MTKFISKSHFYLLTFKYVLQHKTMALSMKYDRNVLIKKIILSFLGSYIILYKDGNLTIICLESQFIFFRF